MREFIFREQETTIPVKGKKLVICAELVRCKDCRHGYKLCADYISCEISEENESGCHASHKPEWFCADGERGDS